MKLNDNAKLYAPWSLTKTEVANSCSLRFKWQYVEKRKQLAPVGPATRIGSAAHKVLELMLKGEKDITRAIKVASVETKLTTSEIEDVYFLRDAITNFLARIEVWAIKNPIQKKYIELKFGITEDFKETGFFSKDAIIRGAIDLGIHTANKNSLVILDHKSGAPKPLDNHKDQLHIYAVSGKVILPTITGVETGLHWLKTQSLEWNEFLPADKITDELFPWLIEFLNKAADKFCSSPDTPTKGYYCGFCPYKSDCPLFKKEDVNAKEVSTKEEK